MSFINDARSRWNRSGAALAELIGIAGPDPETLPIGGLPIAVVSLEEAAEAMALEALRARGTGRVPRFITSANGQVIALCAKDPSVRALFDRADLIHADGMPMVFASRIAHDHPLPERVATTDLFPRMMEISSEIGLRHFLLGATPDVNQRTIAALKQRYPRLPEIAGHHGYIADIEDEVIRRVDDFAPDVLWVGMGVPREQAFVLRARERLTRVGVIKTAGGLFDFVVGDKRRAPKLLQDIGLEWLWRMMLEPTRLGPRYLKTNLVALRLMLARPKP